MDFEDSILIPKARIAVLIGKKGTTKRKIEKTAGVKLLVDSSEGLVTICGRDALSVALAKDVVQAIARGFNPELAMELFKEGFVLDVISISDYVRGKSGFQRIRGVLIGTKGKARRVLEQHTGTNISIYGKTVAIIGKAEDVIVAHKAIEMFLMGASHASVYKFLERSHGRRT
jgi:ribosomal RNA assembly protein